MLSLIASMLFVSINFRTISKSAAFNVATSGSSVTRGASLGGFFCLGIRHQLLEIFLTPLPPEPHAVFLG
jgi:hypothetical protein